MSVTTKDAKYHASRHTAGSPVPGNLVDFVEYRRSDAILDPNVPQSRPNTGYNNYASEISQFLISSFFFFAKKAHFLYLRLFYGVLFLLCFFIQQFKVLLKLNFREYIYQSIKGYFLRVFF